MLKLIQVLRTSKHPGIKILDDELQILLGQTPQKSLQEVADHLLAKGKELADQRLLTLDLLKIDLYKIKSDTWNVLKIYYWKHPYSYHMELVQISDQITLSL